MTNCVHPFLHEENMTHLRKSPPGSSEHGSSFYLDGKEGYSLKKCPEKWISLCRPVYSLVTRNTVSSAGSKRPARPIHIFCPNNGVSGRTVQRVGMVSRNTRKSDAEPVHQTGLFRESISYGFIIILRDSSVRLR